MTRRTLALALLLILATPSGAPVISPAGTSADAAATPSGLSRGRIGAPLGPSATARAADAPSLSESSTLSHGVPASSLPQAAYAVPEPIGSVAASPSGEVSTALIAGLATWYDACARCAAAGPALRSMLGSGWRGTVVTVEGPAGATVSVILSDWCACGERHGLATVLDLSRQAFSQLAHPSAGIVRVSVEVGSQLPATDAVQ